MRPIVVIPAYKPDDALLRLTEELEALFSPLIIVVDDGSGEESASIFERLAKSCFVIRHKSNRGKGAALKSAAAYITANYPGAPYVTADADFQHLPEDIYRTAKELETYPESFVLGVRDFSAPSVPLKSRWGNLITRALFRIASGLSCKDTQTGLRGIPALFVAKSASLPGRRFEYELNQLLAAARTLPLIQIPIQTVYNGGNRSTHFRPLVDSLRICLVLLKFCCSSIICACLDLLVFSLALFALAETSDKTILAATVTARLFSGICNFTLNRRWVFGFVKPKSAAWAAVKYFALFCVLMFASWLLVSFLSVLPFNIVFLKALADTALFVLSYHIQRTLVFPPSDSRRFFKKRVCHESVYPKRGAAFFS